MMTPLEFLSDLGVHAGPAFWWPLAAWSLLALLIHLAIAVLPGRSVALQFDLRMAVIVSLPVGLALAAASRWVPVSADLIPAVRMEWAVSVSPVDSASGVYSLPMILLGIATVVAATLAAAGCVRLVRDVLALKRFHRNASPVIEPSVVRALQLARMRLGLVRGYPGGPSDLARTGVRMRGGM